MSNVVWKYVSPLKEGTEVELLELKYCYVLPNDLKECLIKNNAGVPSKDCFDMGNNKGMVFGGLLSFNSEDLDNIYDIIDLFKTNDGNVLRMFPFGLDPAGNFFCVENNKIVFYDHDFDETTVICNSFTEFLDMLYD